MKKSLGIILFVIIATLLYSTSKLTKKEELNSTLTKENEVNLTLTKREEILLISKNIKSIQQELNQINNKNAKLNSTFFVTIQPSPKKKYLKFSKYGKLTNEL